MPVHPHLLNAESAIGVLSLYFFDRFDHRIYLLVLRHQIYDDIDVIDDYDEERDIVDEHEIRRQCDGLVPLHEVLGDVNVYGLYLMGLVLCHMSAQRTLIFANDIFSCVHISKGYGEGDNVIFC